MDPGVASQSQASDLLHRGQCHQAKNTKIGIEKSKHFHKILDF